MAKLSIGEFRDTQDVCRKGYLDLHYLLFAAQNEPSPFPTILAQAEESLLLVGEASLYC